MLRTIFFAAILSQLAFSQTPSASFLGTDSSTFGNWAGKYGADGQLIPSALTNAPSYASVNIVGQTWVWQSSTSDTRALQVASGSTSRIASTYFGNTFTVDLNLTDGKAHKISLYLLDWDRAGRGESITIVNAATQAALSTQSFSAFYNGVYAAWSIQGHVQIQLAVTAGPNALINGMFFDSAVTTSGGGSGTASASYVGTDTTTIGNWTGKYGADGEFIASDLSNAPSYASVNVLGQSWIWAASTGDPRALQAASGATSRIASTYYNNSFTIDVNLQDGKSHKVSLYLLDYDRQGRAETVSIVDAASNKTLSTQTYSSFQGGVYATWTIQGHVLIQLVGSAGPNAVASGIFFDPASAAVAPTVSLTANPANINSGAGSTLTWTSSNATACTASGGWSGAQTTSGSTSVSPGSTTTYILSCTGTGGTAQASATVTVTPVTALASWVYVNGQYMWPDDWSWSVTANYSSTAGSPLSGAFDIQIKDTIWGGWQPHTGAGFDLTPYTNFTVALQPTAANQMWTLSFRDINNNQIGSTVNVLSYGLAPVVGKWGVYTVPLSAVGATGTIGTFVIQDQSGLATNTWYIDNVGFLPQGVSPGSVPPTVTLSAGPLAIQSGANSTLKWSSTNASSCTASNGWTGAVATSGTKTVYPTNTTGYNISCSGPGGTSTATAAVTVYVPGTFSIQVAGNKLVNSSGATVQLRGVNLSGMEFTAIDGWDPADPTGGQMGLVGGPNWPAISKWRANVVRIPLNEDSWLGLTCTDTDGVVHNADPGGNYKQTVANLVQQANKAGTYVILDLHWAAPGNSCPMLQSQMADADHSLAFWSSIASTYKNNPAVMFELFNEPFLDFDFTGDAWQYLMFGKGGAFSGYPASSTKGTWLNVQNAWKIASYQDMINAVRATGATNVILVGSVSYTADLSGWLSHRPSDPINQVAATWHPYPTFGATWGTAAWAQPNYSPQIFSEVQTILASGVPVIATETGDQDTAGTVGAPLVQTITNFADANGVSVLGWTWDVWNSPDFVLIKDANGTPTDGYGQFFQSWMVNHP